MDFEVATHFDEILTATETDTDTQTQIQSETASEIRIHYSFHFDGTRTSNAEKSSLWKR